MQGSDKNSVRNVTEGAFIKNLGLKARKWLAITPGEDIEQDNLAGIIVSAGGTLILIDGDETELDCGTVTANTLVVYPLCPLKVKTGSSATTYAVYEA